MPGINGMKENKIDTTPICLETDTMPEEIDATPTHVETYAPEENAGTPNATDTPPTQAETDATVGSKTDPT